MTATPVRYVLDELGSVVDAQPVNHPLRRVDRDNARIYEGGGTFDMDRALTERTGDLRKSNFVGATYADRSDEYLGTGPTLRIEEVVGVRAEGYAGDWGHVDPTGTNGVVFAGTDDSLVQQCIDTLYDGLAFPDAGRTDVGFKDLAISNQSPRSDDWVEYYRYDFDVVFAGFEDL